MRAGETTALHCPPDTTLRDEITSLGDDGVMEMANLSSRQTGIDGVVFISTAMGSHGARVKYFVKAGKDQPSFSVSIGDRPDVVANSLPDRVVSAMAPQVIEWVQLNNQALLSFWNDGDAWSDDEVTAFKASLAKLPQR